MRTRARSLLRDDCYKRVFVYIHTCVRFLFTDPHRTDRRSCWCVERPPAVQCPQPRGRTPGAQLMAFLSALVAAASASRTRSGADCVCTVGGSQPQRPLIRGSLSAHVSSWVFSLCRLLLPHVSAFQRKSRPCVDPASPPRCPLPSPPPIVQSRGVGRTPRGVLFYVVCPCLQIQEQLLERVCLYFFYFWTWKYSRSLVSR